MAGRKRRRPSSPSSVERSPQSTEPGTATGPATRSRSRAARSGEVFAGSASREAAAGDSIGVQLVIPAPPSASTAGGEGEEVELMLEPEDTAEDTAAGYPTMALVRTVSSLTDVAAELQALQITETNQAHLVRFRLDEQAPLQEAFNISAETNPGRHGFILDNPELLKCKTKAKAALETSFNTMLDASLDRIDEDLQGVEASLGALRVLVRYNDNQMGHNGPPLAERNRGTQHCIYPHPPFPRDPSFEHGTAQQRVPYQHAYATQQERDEAAARDRRAQRALWNAKLRILEARQSLLKEMRSEMMSKMRAEFKRIMEQRSDLGAGYADYEFPPLA